MEVTAKFLPICVSRKPVSIPPRTLRFDHGLFMSLHSGQSCIKPDDVVICMVTTAGGFTEVPLKSHLYLLCSDELDIFYLRICPE